MTEERSKRRAKFNVWTAIDITLIVAGIRLCPPFTRTFEEFDRMANRMPILDLGMYFLFFWLLGLLWLAYREWRVSPVAGAA